MRTFFIILLISIISLSKLNGQENIKGLELKFSLIHPERHRDAYKYTTDPTIEALFNFYISKKFIASAGLMFQTGKHNWEQWANHTVYPEGGLAFPLKGMYDRRFNYLCIGLPLKLEKSTKGKLINAFYAEFTVGRYLQIDLDDYYNSDHIHEFDIGYHGLFRDVQGGIVKAFYKNNNLILALSAMAGVRNQRIDDLYLAWNVTEYFYYGLGISAKFRK